jgi:FtsH-binding integral membrane protein
MWDFYLSVRVIYYTLMTIEMISNFTFTYTVLKTWKLLETRKYLRKNEPSMVFKIFINFLNLFGSLSIMFYMDKVLGGFFDF